MRECGVRQENITKLLGFMVYSQEGIEFIGICSTSYTSTKTQNPDSRGFFCCISLKEHLQKLAVLSCASAEKHFCTSGKPCVSRCICNRGANSLVFTALRTSREKGYYRLSWLLAVWGFVSCHQHDVMFMSSSWRRHHVVVIMSHSCHHHVVSIMSLLATPPPTPPSTRCSKARLKLRPPKVLNTK